MGLAITITERVSIGGTDYLYFGEATFDNSYPTGGEPLDLTTATNIKGPANPRHVYAFPGAAGGIPSWDKANAKIRLNSTGTGTEVANAFDASTYVIPFIAVGP